MKRLRPFLTLLILLAFCLPMAFAASTTNTISWTNATTYTDGTPFTSLCCTNIWRATDASGTGATFLTQVKGSATSYADVVTTTGTFCYAVQTVSSKAGDAGSAITPYVCKTVGTAPPPVTSSITPKSPGNLAVT